MPQQPQKDYKQKGQGGLIDTFDPRASHDVLKNLQPHPTTGRLIDSHPGKRTRPMRVLCLGMSRTGSMSLYTALQKLGYKPYHMAVAMDSPKSSLGLWTEALQAKYEGKGKPWGREEFDKLLGDYDGICDVPGCVFVEELTRAYPEAKVVLTTRDVDAWLKSMQSTAGTCLAWPTWSYVAPWDKSLTGPWWSFANVVMPHAYGTLNDFYSLDCPPRSKFGEHNELVKRVVPKERLLEFQVKQGWRPLCDFLGDAAPGEDFPWINDKEEFLWVHGLMWWIAVGKMAAKVGATVAVPAIGYVAALWWQRRH